VRGKIVIDATNPQKPDGSGLASEGGLSGAEIIASWLPGAPFKP
jgi:predicted dinucleotide-binding enzyme